MYKCICGKEFNSSQALNSHKANCKEYLQSIDKWESRCKKLHDGGVNSAKSRIKNNIDKKQVALEKWVSEKHVCEHCGKIMTEKFGSGRFCCRACANARVTSAKQRASASKQMSHLNTIMKIRSNTRQLKLELEYSSHPNYCIICGNVLDWSHRYNKTCSEECRRKRLSEFAALNVAKHEGNLNTKNSGYKHGYYHDIYCASSYELAFVVYCLEHEIKIRRNTQGFSYQFNGESHTYYPDFIIDENTYVETKNYYTELVQAKIDYFPKNLIYKIIYKQEMKQYLTYCIEKYGRKFYEVLYEK